MSTHDFDKPRFLSTQRKKKLYLDKIELKRDTLILYIDLFLRNYITVILCYSQHFAKKIQSF